jgi:hypothetical protein
MSNIIDSLKRLERIGDENSKTTQKLIQAADELASSIVEQFAAAPTESPIVLDTYHRKVQVKSFHTYAIIKGLLVFSGHGLDGYVARDRENALAFSKDIANGLLDLLAEILAERLKATAGGLAAIQTANPKIE